MILTAQNIRAAHEASELTIDPFDPTKLNPNSYNFGLASILERYTNPVLDPRQDNPTESMEIEEQGLVLRGGELYLGHTQETIGSDLYVPMIFARSSIARLGLFIHATAPLGDLGFFGQWSLQLIPVRDVRIYPNMDIGQVLFLTTTHAQERS